MPESAFGQVPVEPVPKDALGLLGRVGVLADEVVESALRIELQSPKLSVPGSFHPVRGVAELGEPSESASRLAGSIVTTQDLSPSRAPWRASAAEIVVLPTPPDPHPTTMLWSDRIDRQRLFADLVQLCVVQLSVIQLSVIQQLGFVEQICVVHPGVVVHEPPAVLSCNASIPERSASEITPSSSGPISSPVT